MKSLLQIFITAAVFIVSTIGCRNPINAGTADRYYQAGFQAENAGNLVLARKDFYRSYVNTVAGNLGPGAAVAALYEWSRVTGHLGIYAEAEAGFTNTLMLIEKAHGEADKWQAPTLCELARMLHDTNEHARVIPVFEKAIHELERQDFLKLDPIGFAEFLDDYAQSLKAAGFGKRAEKVARRSAIIKEANLTAVPKYKTQRYGTNY